MMLKLWFLTIVLLAAGVTFGQTSVNEVLGVQAIGQGQTAQSAGAATNAAPGAPGTAAAPAPSAAQPTDPAAAKGAVTPPPADSAAAPKVGASAAGSIAPPAGAYLLSIYKPIFVVIFLGLWAWVVTKFDKDLRSLFLKRELWNGVQLGVAGLGFLLWFLIPAFWGGLFVNLLLIGGSLGGYIFYRNTKVDEGRKWTVKSVFDFEKWRSKHDDDTANKAALIKLIAHDGKIKTVPQADEPYYAAHEAMENLLDWAMPRRAEKIELLADGQATTIGVQIDGVRYPQDQKLDAKVGLALIDYLKQSAGLDVADRRRRQAGKLQFQDGEGARHVLMINTQGSTKGLALTGHIDPPAGPPPTLDKIGFMEVQKQQLFGALEKPGRVVIVTAPSQAGQTTMLYALASRHDPYTQSVIALEGDMEYELEGVTHEKLDATMDAAAINQKLKNSMLREAHVVLMPKVVDSASAAMMAQYAEQSRFYIGMRYEDTFTAVKAWVKVVGDTKAAANSLNSVVASRLLRRLCKTCRVPYKPDGEVLRKLNLPPDKVGQFYKHSGQVMVKDHAEPCPDCLGIGYRGRIGVFEVLVMDDEGRALLATGQVEPLRTHLRKNRMLWMQEAALAKVIEGETSIAEITRVLAAKQGQPS